MSSSTTRRATAASRPCGRDGLALRVIALNSNVGFASANNAGIRRTESELVLLLNSDTIVPEGAIDRLIAALRELPGASIVGPKIVDGAGARSCRTAA